MTAISPHDWTIFMLNPEIRLIEYARGPHGLLSRARYSALYSPRLQRKARSIALVANDALSAFRHGRVDLVQRKDGQTYIFIAIKRVSRRRRKCRT